MIYVAVYPISKPFISTFDYLLFYSLPRRKTLKASLRISSLSFSGVLSSVCIYDQLFRRPTDKVNTFNVQMPLSFLLVFKKKPPLQVGSSNPLIVLGNDTHYTFRF